MNTWGPFQKGRLSENSEYVNPEMRKTLGFPFSKGEVCQTGSRVSHPVSEREVTYTQSRLPW